MNWNRVLINASRDGSLKLVKLALKHGADVHAEDNAALRSASYYRHPATVKLLLKHGADVQAMDN